MTPRSPRTHVLTCPSECGYVTAKPTTVALARRGLALHSCERHREKAARSARHEQMLASIDRTPKPCTHKRAEHEHGTYVTYVADECRCRPCVDAAVTYERTRIRRTAYGQWQPFVDAEPVRAHIRELTAAGMGLKRIMAAAGVSGGTMAKLVYGVHGRPPSRGVRPATSARILAVEPDLAAGARVPAEPTWRLIHGLIALGYPKSWVARQLGQRGPGLQLSTSWVTKAHADTIRAVADRYGATRGPSERARRYAAVRGWTADLLWLDDDEDEELTPERRSGVTATVDEVAVIRACAGEPQPLNRPERLEAVRRLRAGGLTYPSIADRLHVAQRQVHRDLVDLGLVAAAVTA